LEQEAWASREVWGLIVATGVGSSLATFLLSGFSDSLKGKLYRMRAARYAAICCSIGLERYAVDCWDIYTMAKGEFDRHRDVSPQPLPDAPSYPDDIEWNSLDPLFADEILSFENGSRIAQSQAEYARLWESNPFEFQEAAKDRGWRALTLAGRVRKRYELDAPKDLDRLWKGFKV
jgi:hypothetical protein